MTKTASHLKSFLRGAAPAPYRRLQEVLSRWRVKYVTKSLISHVGLVIQDGPFAGMRYVPEAVGSTLTPKLLGSYEAELQPTLQIILRSNYKAFVDIGCAEGYYAIGIALKLPGAVVYAFDIDHRGRELCRQMARANMVDDRVLVQGECSHEVLRSLATARTLVICDCEGCELDLLQPSLVPELTNCDLLVELHDLFAPGLTKELVSRFEPTHVIKLIDSQERDPGDYPVLRRFSGLNQRVAVSEFRDGPMQWAFMTSKKCPPASLSDPILFTNN